MATSPRSSAAGWAKGAGVAITSTITLTLPAAIPVLHCRRHFPAMCIALYNVAMTETATIRVSRETRDLLADQARGRGISIASLVSEIAMERHQEAVFRGERDATEADQRSREAQAELDDWDETIA